MISKIIKRKLKNIASPFNFLIILFIALIIRLILLSYGTLDLDFNTFLAWSDRLTNFGPGHFYDNWSDYLPGYLYVLWFLGIVNKLGILAPSLLYKFPSILSDLIGAFFIYKIAGGIFGKRRAFWAGALYVLNPALIANSTLWGQVDSITSTLSIAAIYYLPRNYLVSAAVLSLGAIVKPQVAIAALVAFVYMIRYPFSWKRIGIYISFSAFVFLILFIPFWNGGDFLSFVVQRIQSTLGQYPYTSVNAFNFWSLGGLWKSEGGGILNEATFGLLIFLTSFVFSFLKFKNKKGWQYYLLFFGYLANYLFFTRMHERHMLSAISVLAIFSFQDIVNFSLYSLLSINYVANLYYSFNWIKNDFQQVFSQSVIALIAILNLLVFIVFLFKKNIFSLMKKMTMDGDFEFKDKINRKSAIFILLVIVFFSLGVRLINLGYPKNEYFDEVYHAWTAKQIMHGNAKAWDYMSEHPAGFAYEWTHPPLAKEIMIIGMLVFGENSFGYRLPAVLFGVLSLVLVFLISYEIFKSYDIAVFSILVLGLDGLFLTMSRIGMNDIYFVTFMLLSLLAFMKNRVFLAALFYGASLASKWSALYFLPIIILSHFIFKKKIRLTYFWFLIIPPTFYFVSYLPMFLSGFDLNHFWDTQRQMWWYHTGLSATHPYSSPWWSWPILIRPVYLFLETANIYAGEAILVSKIYAMGNPFIFWGGVAAFILSLWFFWKKRFLKLGFIIFSYLIFFVPWALSPRIMFLYHYLPSLPFLSIMVAFILKIWQKYALVFFLVSFLLFLYFYPHWTGVYVTERLDSFYYWFSSWR